MGQMSEGSSPGNPTQTIRSLSQSHGQKSAPAQQRVVQPRSERQRIRLDKHKEDKLDRETRWMFFLNLRHENEGTKEAIIAAVDPGLDPLSYQYEDLWRAIMTKVGHLRSSMLKNLLVSIAHRISVAITLTVGRSRLRTRSFLMPAAGGMFSSSLSTPRSLTAS